MTSNLVHVLYSRRDTVFEQYLLLGIQWGGEWIFCHFLKFCICTDSPGIPPSANAHELFRGFSFVAPCLLDQEEQDTVPAEITSKQVSLSDPVRKVKNSVCVP